MRLARVLGAIGRALISAGVIVLLFVAYQLWGTGLQHAQAQGDLEDDFLELLDSDLATEGRTAAVDASDPADDGTDGDDGDGTDAGSGDADADSEDATDDDGPTIEPRIVYSPEYLEAVYPPEGDSLARIVIPAIGVDQITVEGVSVEDLRKGPGHYPSTPNPGQAGNSAIAGHRTTYGAPFHRIDELEPGDEIVVTTIQGTFTYLVRSNEAPDGTTKGHFIVSPSDTWVLGQESGENLLTLTACHPKYSARQRIIVQASLVGEPVATPPRGDTPELEPVQISAGAEDEGGDAPATEDDAADAAGDGEPGDDVAEVMSDAVAADDDPDVEADGTPLDDADAGSSGADGTDAGGADAGDDGDEEGAGGTDDRDDATVTTASEDRAADATGGDGEPDSVDDVELTAGETRFDGDDDFGEGLDGDPTKVRPAVMWGLAGGSIWLASWFIGMRLQRKWTLYLIGLIAFAPVLWSCFVNIDQALPSY